VHALAGVHGRVAGHFRDQRCAAGLIEMHVGLLAETLDQRDVARERRRVGRGAERQMFGADAERDGCARRERGAVARQRERFAGGHERDGRAPGVAGDDDGRQEVHPRRADEAGDEAAGRMVIEVERRADLRDAAVPRGVGARVQQHDLVGERHRLGLVVRHVDDARALELPMQLRDLDARLAAQCRVEVRQRFVEQEHPGLAHDRAADRDALPLSAGQRLRLALEQRVELQDPRGVAHLAVDLGLRHARELQAERHVLVDGHVRKQRVALEHHRDAALGGRHVVDAAAVDRQLAVAQILEARDHPQQRRLAAARRAQEHAELVRADVQIDVAYDRRVLAISLLHATHRDARHCLRSMF
jgi:hypothetical protein